MMAKILDTRFSAKKKVAFAFNRLFEKEENFSYD